MLPTGPPLWVPHQICAGTDRDPHVSMNPLARGGKARLTWELLNPPVCKHSSMVSPTRLEVRHHSGPQ